MSMNKRGWQGSWDGGLREWDTREINTQQKEGPESIILLCQRHTVLIQNCVQSVSLCSALPAFSSTSHDGQ